MKKIVDPLLEWYLENKRMLPWRKTKDPYHIWISEIMLQQTRIEAVIPYYERFMRRLPDISSLASINEDELLKLWEGLGYYNRARNLKKAALIIMKDYNGIFPDTYEEIKKLPGIGEYTASAIASICFNEQTPTVDGNVLRVLARVKEDKRNVDLIRTKKEVRKELEKIIPEDSGNFNESLMELGEVICLPNTTPKCEICPIKAFCKANLHQSWNKFPKKGEKSSKKQVFYTILLISFKDEYAISKRNEKQILHSLWEFPNLEGKLSKKEVEEYLKSLNIKDTKIKRGISSKHIFTHQIWYLTSFEIELTNKPAYFTWKKIEEIKKDYAIPGAFKPFLEEIKNQEKHKIEIGG